MSYFESLSESNELLIEEPICDDGILGTAAVSQSKKKCTTKNSTLLNHFTVKKQNNDTLCTTDCNCSHSQNSNPHSNSDELHDPVMSQEEIDHLFTDDDFDSWFDDIT